MRRALPLLFLAGLGALVASVLLSRTSAPAPRASSPAQVVVVNDRGWARQIRVVDRNAGDAVRFEGRLGPGARQAVPCAASDSGYCRIATAVDGRPLVNRPFVRPGDRVVLD